MKQVSAAEYGIMVGKSRQWVVHCILHGNTLPQADLIKSIQKVGKAYVITLKTAKSK